MMCSEQYLHKFLVPQICIIMRIYRVQIWLIDIDSCNIHLICCSSSSQLAVIYLLQHTLVAAPSAAPMLFYLLAAAHDSK
jgi:hypothetical protein